MDFYNSGKNVKSKKTGNLVAVAANEEHAEIIVKALNFYFGETYTTNEAVAAMHRNTANALNSIAAFSKKHEYTGEMLCDYLIEVAEEMNAQSLVVEMRTELKFNKPK